MLMTILFCRSWYCGICFLGVLIWQFFLSPLLPCFTLLPVLLLSCQTHLRYCLFKGRKWLLAGMVVVLLKTDVGRNFIKMVGWGSVTCFTFLKSTYFFLIIFLSIVMMAHNLVLNLERSDKWMCEYIGKCMRQHRAFSVEADR